MADFYLKQNDTKPSIQATLKNADGTAIDLTDATVDFHMSLNGVNVVDAAAVVVTALSGIVRYDWAAADTDTPGTYDIEWEITFVDASIRTVPNSRHDKLVIYPELH